MQDLLNGGAEPAAILGRCREAMVIVGRRFEEGDYFLPELIMAGEILRKISDVVNAKLAGREKMPRGWEKSCSHGAGGHPRHRQGHRVFYPRCERLYGPRPGVDVPEERFVAAIREVQPRSLP